MLYRKGLVSVHVQSFGRALDRGLFKNCNLGINTIRPMSTHQRLDVATKLPSRYSIFVDRRESLHQWSREPPTDDGVPPRRASSAGGERSGAIVRRPAAHAESFQTPDASITTLTSSHSHTTTTTAAPPTTYIRSFQSLYMPSQESINRRLRMATPGISISSPWRPRRIQQRT